jgi:hypothetical protein
VGNWSRAVVNSRRDMGLADFDMGTGVGMDTAAPFAVFPRGFGVCPTACPEVRSWLAF